MGSQKSERKDQIKMDLVMTLQRKISLNNIMKSVESKIGESCPRRTIDGKTWFIVDEDYLVHMRYLCGDKENCLVVRHAKSTEETHLAEDGGYFYPEDYHTVDEMTREILREVWSRIIA